jgi:ArsR family transcriptional regulator
MLANEKAYICGNIAKNIPLAQSTISQHLKVLKDAGLIRGTVDGPRICYCLEPKMMRRLKVLVVGI